jgi:Protein of unknown function (DUF4058)
MRPQFPGMDPWLESTDLWPDLHNSLIGAIRDVLNPLVFPRYVVRVEARTTVLSGPDSDRLYRPDVAIRASNLTAPHRVTGPAVMERIEVQPIEVVVPVDEIEETYLTIKDLRGRKLVTVIEVLSPTNKRTKDARAEYLDKRRHLIRSKVNLVEIDLLRGGEPMPLYKSPPPNDYRILISRARPERKEVIYVFPWTIPVPAIPIPLLPDDADPSLDLNSVLHSLLDRAHYDVDIDYRRPPKPRLRPADKLWAATFLAQANATNGAPETPAGEDTTP